MCSQTGICLRQESFRRHEQCLLGGWWHGQVPRSWKASSAEQSSELCPSKGKNEPGFMDGIPRPFSHATPRV